jgi:hypothetical protein
MITEDKDEDGEREHSCQPLYIRQMNTNKMKDQICTPFQSHACGYAVDWILEMLLRIIIIGR